MSDGSQLIFDEPASEQTCHPPACRQIVHEKEIQAEDDQVFLVKLQVGRTSCCFCVHLNLSRRSGFVH